MVSTRNREKNVTYSVGDRVEIVRPGNLDVGILLSKTDDSGRDSPSSNSSSTHWVVSVEGNSKEEDVSERYLGRVLPPREDEEAPAASNNGRGANGGRRSPRSTGERGATAARKPSTRQDSKANSTDDDENEDGGNNSSSSGGNEKSGAAANTTSKSKKSARGGRQAKKTAHKKGATQAKASASDTAAANSAPRKYATRRGKGDDQELFDGIDVDKIKNKKKVRAPAPKVGPDETVIAVKMLTGTLYLYRGINGGRAEFIRVV